MVLTLGVPPKAIEERENARIAATQQRQDYPEDEGSSNFNSDKDNWSDKECSKYHADTSQVGNSTLIQATGCSYLVHLFCITPIFVSL